MTNQLICLSVTSQAYDRTCWAVVHGDCYVTITVYLHKNPSLSQPWKSVCYIMITVDRGSTSMFYIFTLLLKIIPKKRADYFLFRVQRSFPSLHALYIFFRKINLQKMTFLTLTWSCHSISDLKVEAQFVHLYNLHSLLCLMAKWT